MQVSSRNREMHVKKKDSYDASRKPGDLKHAGKKITPWLKSDWCEYKWISSPKIQNSLPCHESFIHYTLNMTERQPGREADTESVCVCVMGVSIKSLINWLLLWGTNLDCRALWDWTNQEVINYTPPLFNCQSKPTGWREEMQRGVHTQAPAPTVSQSAPTVRQDTAARTTQSHTLQKHTFIALSSTQCHFPIFQLLFPLNCSAAVGGRRTSKVKKDRPDFGRLSHWAARALAGSPAPC